MDGIRGVPQKIVRSSTEGIQAGTPNQCQVQQFRKYPFLGTPCVFPHQKCIINKMHHPKHPKTIRVQSAAPCIIMIGVKPNFMNRQSPTLPFS